MLLDRLTLFPEVSPASPSQPLAVVPEQKTTETFGPKCSDSFAKLNPAGYWQKTSQGYSQLMMDGSLEAFSGTWPRAGMTRNGTAYLLPPSAPLTGETESGSWPTPHASCWTGAGRAGRSGGPNLQTAAQYPTPKATRGTYQRNVNGRIYMTLEGMAKMWATPNAADGVGSHGGGQGRSLRTDVHSENKAGGGQLNPRWVEWLMGLPIGWTDLNCSETAKSFKSSVLSGKE